MQELTSVFSIIGIVVGVGFLSGKEILTFYSRFGIWSFLAIILSFFIFWLLFSFLLNFNQKSDKSSKFSIILSLITTLVFTSAMFAGVNSLIYYDNKIITFCLFCIVLMLCFLIFKNGLGILTKINFICLPIIIVAIILLFAIFFKPYIAFENSNFQGLSIPYALFYCILNIANGSFVLINIGKGLRKKQRARVSFFSALVLAILLLAVNIILLQNPQSFLSEMPILYLCKGPLKSIMKFVMLLGALTSLLSLIYTSSSLLKGLCKNSCLTFCVCIIFPCVTSLVGFSLIITYFYPIASALGMFLMGELFLEKHKQQRIKI